VSSKFGKWESSILWPVREIFLALPPLRIPSQNPSTSTLHTCSSQCEALRQNQLRENSIGHICSPSVLCRCTERQYVDNNDLGGQGPYCISKCFECLPKRINFKTLQRDVSSKLCLSSSLLHHGYLSGFVPGSPPDKCLPCPDVLLKQHWPIWSSRRFVSSFLALYAQAAVSFFAFPIWLSRP
jgi:hypothetical protein